MNTILKSKTIVLLIVVLLICVPLGVYAQPGFNGGMTDGAPIDGGLSMLIVAGAVYGVNKLKKKKDSMAEKDEMEQMEK
jgi:hypothetical protein